MPPLEKSEPVFIKSVEVLRHALGSIDVSDVPNEKEMTESDRKVYVGIIAAAWPKIEQDIKRFTYQQVLAIAESDTWEKVNYGRGTCNGLSLLYEYWKQIDAESKTPPAGSFDKTNPMPEV